MQLSLLPASLRQCSWVRLPRSGQGIVLAVSKPLPLGLAPWLRSQGWRLKAYAEDRGQAAVWLVGGNTSDLMAWLPEPEKRGSQTAGNLLPW